MSDMDVEDSDGVRFKKVEQKDKEGKVVNTICFLTLSPTTGEKVSVLISKPARPEFSKSNFIDKITSGDYEVSWFETLDEDNEVESATWLLHKHQDDGDAWEGPKVKF